MPAGGQGGGEVRFGLLGLLTVHDDAGEPVRVPGARLRVLLAALLLDANAPVGGEVLAEAVWDGMPTPAADRTLPSHVARLRRALGDTGAGRRIEAREPGYLIRVQPEELDTLEFEMQCRDASEAVQAGSWDQAEGAATRALALRRGEPLLDVPSQTLRDRFVPRLEQLRLQVFEDHAEAMLRLGRHEQLLPRLRELAGAHPLREHFHAQLISALAGCGRRAEALEAYQDARRELVDQLGVEPGPELRALHQLILAGEQTQPAAQRLSGPALTRTAQVEAVPRQLPAAPRHFTGRYRELELLTAPADRPGTAGGAAGTVVICAVDGMAGIGKTALAVHAAHRLAEKFPGGQLFLDLHGYTQGHQPREPGQALEALLRALAVPPNQIPHDAEECAALYRQRLAGTRTLVVLDNALNEGQVRPEFRRLNWLRFSACRGSTRRAIASTHDDFHHLPRAHHAKRPTSSIRGTASSTSRYAPRELRHAIGIRP